MNEPSGDLVKEVYANFGLAIYLSQVLEHGIVNALVYLELIPSKYGKVKEKSEWESEFDNFMGRHFKGTLGRIINSLKSATKIPEDLESVLSEALEKRNELSHGYFRHRAEAFMTVKGCEEIIAELQEAHELFDAADTLLEKSMVPLREKFGITEERFQEYFEKHVEKARNDL